MNRTIDPYNTRGIMGRFPETATTNQQVLYMLADGTGGFVIANTNDLLGGLQKINREQNEYYLVGYNPPDSKEGSCHTIAVKVKGGYNIRARTGYCNVKSADLLAGTPVEKQLETAAKGTQAPTIQAPPMQVPFFYTSANTARIHVSIDIPTDKIKFEKVKGKEHAEISVMGIAYRPDGNVAAKFSDSVKLDLEDKKAMEKFTAKPMHYQNQFDIGSGEYNLKVVFTSGGAGFGKLETPLSVDPFDPQHPPAERGLPGEGAAEQVGGVRLGRHVVPVHGEAAEPERARGGQDGLTARQPVLAHQHHRRVGGSGAGPGSGPGG